MSPSIMRAVVLKGKHEVAVEDVPYPSIRDPGDAVVQVLYSGLCGTDLHYYRGHGALGLNYVLGHEAVGRIVEMGPEVKGFNQGDLVVSPFSLSCGDCFYCRKGYTSRCASGVLLGTSQNPGAQAEYVRIPLASSSLFPLDSSIPPELSLMLCDILPTGLTVATNARTLLNEEEGGDKGSKTVCLVIGCGPVGLCAITAATQLFDVVFATDLTPSRLVTAKKHGAIAVSPTEVQDAVLKATEGRGADAALEVVGNQKAMELAVEIVRPYGAVSSCGIHNGILSLVGPSLYGKNLRFQFGRCSVQTFYQRSVDLLKANVELFSAFIEKTAPLEEAPEWYSKFERGEVGKTVFKPGASS